MGTVNGSRRGVLEAKRPLGYSATPMMHGARSNILDAVGDTPLVRLRRVVPPDLRAEIYVKCEFLNPGGSLKDRAARSMVDALERDGRLKSGGTLVEATSGSTGAALAMVAAVRGYRTVFVVPEKTSQEKIATLRAWGAKVVVCPAVDPNDPRGFLATARRLAEETPNAVFVDQFHNPANPEGHYASTGPELWAQTQGELDVLVAGVGTGGALAGTGKYLKEKKPEITLVGVDPVGSVYFDFVKRGLVTRPFSYKVEGPGGDFFPAAANLQCMDDCVRVDDRECFTMTRELARQEGIFCGGSSGAAVAGAIKWAMARGREERVVVLLPDAGGRYLSTVFHDDWMRENGFLGSDVRLGTVAEVLQGKSRELVTARSDETLRSVIGKMKSHGISQIPVVDGAQIRGLVSEVDVLRNLVSGEAHLEGTIDGILDNDYATVSPDTRVELLQGVLADAKVALVTDGLSLVGLISKIDVIDYLTRRATDLKVP